MCKETYLVEKEGRHVLDVQESSSLFILIHVNLHEFTIFVCSSHLLELRSDLLAWAAPCCCEVDANQLGRK